MYIISETATGMRPQKAIIGDYAYGFAGKKLPLKSIRAVLLRKTSLHYRPKHRSQVPEVTDTPTPVETETPLPEESGNLPPTETESPVPEESELPPQTNLQRRSRGPEELPAFRVGKSHSQ